MPLKINAFNHDCFDQPPRNLYSFSGEQKHAWSLFWEEMDGDLDKILKFAKDSGIENPEEWFESLHHFLFDVFSGNSKLLKKAAKKTFQEFLAQIAENHINDPKDKYWYFNKGLTKQKFIRMIEGAAEVVDLRQAISYLNSRVSNDFGSKVYSEYILSKTPQKKEIISIASEMNKKAWEIESSLSGKYVTVNISDKIKHFCFPKEEFTVTGMHRSTAKIKISGETEHIEPLQTCLIVKDSKGKVGYIFDLWNVEKA